MDNVRVQKTTRNVFLNVQQAYKRNLRMSFNQWPLLGDAGLLLANINDGPNSHKSHC